MSPTFLFPFFFPLPRHDTVPTFLQPFHAPFSSPANDARFMLILLPSPLITCSVLFLSPLLFSRFQYHSRSDPPLSIHSWYPYILSLFAGPLCVHVQHTYTSTLSPTRPISPSLRVSVRCFTSLALIFLPFIRNSCVMCVAVDVLRAVTSSLCRILSALQISCPYNYTFLCPTTLVPFNNSQFFSFIGSATTFERPYNRWKPLPGPLFSTLIDVTGSRLYISVTNKNLWLREDVTRPWVVRKQRCEC